MPFGFIQRSFALVRLLCALSLSLAVRAAAVEADSPQPPMPNVVAVVPFNNSKADLDESSRLLLEDTIRNEAGNLLGGRGYTVLNSDNQLTLLSRNNVDLTKACEESCTLAVAQRLRAGLYISGTIFKSGGTYLVTVRLFESELGRQRGFFEVEGRDVFSIRSQARAKLPELLDKLPRIGVGIGEAEVSFVTKPAGARVRSDGKEVCSATPCNATIAEGFHQIVIDRDGYEPVAQSFTATQGAKLELELKSQSGVSFGPRGPFAIRAGLGTHTGILGVGVEYQLTEFKLGSWERGLKVALGTGTHVVSGGVSFGPPRESGFYLDLHFAVARKGLFGEELAPGVGFGTTAGFDWRPIRWLSVKAGAGVAYNTASKLARPLMFDLAVGPVF